MMRKLLGMVAGALLAMSGTAHAVPMLDFEIDGSASSVSVTTTGQGLACFFTNCGVEAQLNSGLDGTSFSLAAGQSNSFDFIDWSSNGTGGGLFDVEAVLAFSAPAGQSATGSGGGGFITAGGTLVGGLLTWTSIVGNILLADGSSFNVDFQGGVALTLGDITTQATVTATNVVAPVPLPAALPLMAFALGGLVLVGRRRRMMA